MYLGLSQPYATTVSAALDWGRPLLVLVVVLAVWRLYRLRRCRDGLLVTLAVLLCFWSLTALNASIFGLPTVGRYQYLGVVGLALVASELARGDANRTLVHAGSWSWPSPRRSPTSPGSGTLPAGSTGSPSRRGAGSPLWSSPGIRWIRI